MVEMCNRNHGAREVIDMGLEVARIEGDTLVIRAFFVTPRFHGRRLRVVHEASENAWFLFSESGCKELSCSRGPSGAEAGYIATQNKDPCPPTSRKAPTFSENLSPQDSALDIMAPRPQGLATLPTGATRSVGGTRSCRMTPV